MASRSQIARLAQRIEALAEAPRRNKWFAVIHVGVGENEEAATERHYLAHPEDREAAETIIVQYVAAKDGRPVTDGASMIDEK